MINCTIRFATSAVLAFLMCALWIDGAKAGVYDLTGGGSKSDTNSAGILFYSQNAQPTGSGVIDSFVRIQTNNTYVSGYNTTANGVFDTQSTDTFDHAITLSHVPSVTGCSLCVNGVSYYQFNLDINQTGVNPLFSLTDIQVFLTKTGDQSATAFDSNGVLQVDPGKQKLVYRLDAGGKNDLSLVNDTIQLNYNLNSGSGSGEMTMLIPTSLIDTTGGYNNVVLYSQFGTGSPYVAKAGDSTLYPNNEGDEEWYGFETGNWNQGQSCIAGTNNGGGGNAAGTVPEPSSLVLLGAGLLFAARISKKASKKS